MRKTIEVKRIIHMGNHFLKNSEDSERAERLATANFLETILHSADAYKGYTHLASAQIRHKEWQEAWDRVRGHIVLDEIDGPSNAIPRWDDFCADDTRRAYYVHPKL